MALFWRRRSFDRVPLDQPFEINRNSVQSRGIVAWYPPIASRGTGVLRDLAGGNNGIFKGTGEPTWINVDIGLALRFDGADDYISVATDIIGNGVSTISAWLYLLGWGEYNLGRILDNTKVAFYVYPSTLYFTSDGANDAGAAANSMTLNVWKYVAVARTAAGAATFYINGVQSGVAGQNSGTPVVGSAVYIGNNAANSRTLNGLIADLRIYNVALTAAEVWQMYDPATRWDLYAPIMKWWVLGEVSAVKLSHLRQGARIGTRAGW